MAATGVEANHVASHAARNGWRSQVIGTSVMGTDILAWFPDTSAHALTRVVWGGIHGEEVVTSHVLHHALRTVRAIASRAVVIPTVNPDGTLFGMRQNARGVDLNRNFPASNWRAELSPTYWPTTQTRTADHRTQMSSPGTHPGSEPEVQAIIALIDEVQPDTIIDVHTPLNCVINRAARSAPLAEHLARAQDMRIVAGVKEPIYGDAGTWAAERNIDCVTYEMELDTLPSLWHRHASSVAAMLTWAAE
jgi:murein peptide amidase A